MNASLVLGSLLLLLLQLLALIVLCLMGNYIVYIDI